MKRITIEIPDSKYAKLTADAEKLIAVKSKMCRLAGVECPKYKAANIVKEAAEFGAVEYVSNYIESKAEPIYLRRRDIALEGTETYRVLSYFADEDVANKCRMDIFYVTAKEVYFSLKNIKGIELREIIFA